MNPSDERQAFEKWVRDSSLALYLAYDHGRGGYVDPDTWKAFAAWQARGEQEGVLVAGKCPTCSVNMNEVCDLSARYKELVKVLTKFRENRGKHDGPHEFSFRTCCHCDAAYVAAELELDRALASLPEGGETASSNKP